MERKSFPVETKADGDAGEFVALASVFNNIDLVGDRVLPGAFAKTLARFRASGDPIPVVLDHQHGDIMAHIGKADPLAVNETEVGLEVRGELDMDNPVAKQTFKLMKERRLKAWSFAYTVPEGGQKQTKDANEISEIDLIEVGPTLKGANPEAQLQGVKSALAEVANIEFEEMPPELEPDSIIRTDSEGNIVDIKTARVEGTDDEEPKPAESRVRDPLRKRSEDAALEFSSGGMSLRPPPKVKQEDPPPEPPSERELRRQSEDLLMEILSG